MTRASLGKVFSSTAAAPELADAAESVIPPTLPDWQYYSPFCPLNIFTLIIK